MSRTACGASICSAAKSILLRSHWVMVVMDVFTRRIIGFGVERADPCGVSVCRMFNRIIAGKSLPRHLSSDHDPLFRFHRWLANSRILEVERVFASTLLAANRHRLQPSGTGSRDTGF